MNIKEFLKDNLIILDGGMGTLLQKEGLKPGELPERWNISHSDVIKNIHLDYFNSGSNVVNTNTFGANILKFPEEELEEIISAAIKNAKDARSECTLKSEKFIALDIGPTGRMLAPYGDFDFEDAVEVFAKTVRIGMKHGVDLVFIETMSDSYETKAALLAVKENSDLPVFVSNAYSEDGKLLTGASPSAMIAMLEGMGADAIGINCSLGPRALAPIAEEYLKYSSLPIIFKPNAGLPRSENGITKYDVSVSEFADTVFEVIKKGVRIAGGCCGTTPEHISAIKSLSESFVPAPVTTKNFACVSSYTHAVFFGDSPILIGERINPTGKKKFKEALVNNDIDYILKEGLSQQEKGVHILDVNVGLPDIDEVKMLKDVVFELQAIIDLPLQIDTSDTIAMEQALRRYNGKAMINSVNGKKESMDAVFPLAKKYGGLIVALTLDENGIPSTAEGRVEIAKKILDTASLYGIDKKDIIFDPLALTISADSNAAKETLLSLKLIRDNLGCHTSLGVSNVSFGLPLRDVINSTFFALALQNGLSAAIMNPYSEEMMKTYFSYRALTGQDDNCEKYISFASSLPVYENSTTVKTPTAMPEEYKSDLQFSIIKGLKDQAALITKELILENDPLKIVNDEIIPALNIVGKGFEEKTVYLPQLLMSAESAKAAFEIIKENIKKSDESQKSTFIIATVKGDIHDIGKNIVKLLLENYGFAVIDLGKDVSPRSIVDEVIRLHAPIVGLSALMTTTVPAMEETIKLIREEAPWCKVIVGGAVLNKEYADSIGADKYAKDAMEAVRYAQEINL